jgi:Na+-transporting NADH:ubiquinone oxidoreductase subunit C
MLGYLALAADGQTVTGLRFYSHAETPGLGDKIDDPEWLELWVGKQLYDEDGAAGIEVIKGPVPAGSPAIDYQIDGMSGATLTGRGVSNLVRYWVGPHGFGPYLDITRTEGSAPQ